MSREIKFRAWDKEFKRFSESPLKYPICDINYHTDYIWMQYTGLTDKNGIEIYEGDICSVYEVMDYGRGLEDKSYITDIRYEEAAFFVKSDTNDYDTFLSSWFPGGGVRYPQIEFEIIGNIYTNPELLERESK